MILGALEQSNLFGPSNKVLYLKKLVIKSGVSFLILFVLMDAILQKGGYFKNSHCAKMALLTKFRACVSGCDFHKVYTLGVSEQVLFNS